MTQTDDKTSQTITKAMIRSKTALITQPTNSSLSFCHLNLKTQTNKALLKQQMNTKIDIICIFTNRTLKRGNYFNGINVMGFVNTERSNGKQLSPFKF